MRRTTRFTAGALFLFTLFTFPAQAAFSSLYIFGDSLSTTTNNTSPDNPAEYYGKRFTNGRVWAEVLAQRQGLAYDSNKNWSYFGHYSVNLVANVNSFQPLPDANTALFVVWVNSADLYFEALNHGTNLAQWTTAINQSLTNHFKAVTNLYHAKGVRTLIMPNAPDISVAPVFSVTLPSANRLFIRQRAIAYNAAFAATLSQLESALPGLTIYVPDLFSMVDQAMASPATYGLTKTNIGARQDTALSDKSLSGPGANYVFWDQLDPTARFHAVIADGFQQCIAPVRISQLTSLNDSHWLEVANVPVGRNGFVEGTTNLLNWTVVQNITCTNTAQTAFVTTSGLQQSFRLRFPFSWVWP